MTSIYKAVPKSLSHSWKHVTVQYIMYPGALRLLFTRTNIIQHHNTSENNTGFIKTRIGVENL